MTIRVCLAGATGWAGSALARAIANSDDLTLTAAVARRAAGQQLGAALGVERLNCPVYATVAEALAQPCDVFFDYTKPDAAKAHVLTALRHGCHVVIGTSGLSDDDYTDIAAAANAAQRGVLAVGNFALTAVLLQKFAEIAARYCEQWEIIDYARDSKPDAPSGTARELTARLGQIRATTLSVPIEQTQGLPATRGARLNGMQVHSVRLPGYTITLEVIFGLPDQRLTIRHDAGASAEPYVAGALLAIRQVGRLIGLHRGLDSVIEIG
ncbi:4-hydroxy-tetrahydrodipicolinate reductase [Chloroflexus sp.]|uniref:4-hydroxy-tetrahydrodipicolinate reductase n=1 Tax=Chloroflexus sp. TaxID=1904827 RepID=UPI002FDB0B94